MRRIWISGLAMPMAGLIAVAVLAQPGQAQVEQCEKVDESTETVVPDVTITYDSSFFCADAADEGEYAITVSVANRADSSEAVTIDRLELSHTTPRPGGGSGPDATATADGLPVTVAAGETARFDVRGTYELVTTDEGDKANLHLRALGTGATSNEQFTLGINVHPRATGVAEAPRRSRGAGGVDPERACGAKPQTPGAN